jgi:purine-binding chemotaxis protein CheW
VNSFTSKSSQDSVEQNTQYLCFSIKGEDFGVEILKVVEIKGWEDVRKLPEAPDYIKGVIDLRGQVVPIVDLRVRFGEQGVQYLPTTVIIIILVEKDDRQVTLGLVVDSVSDVLDVAANDIRSIPAISAEVNDRYIRGMARATSGDQMIMLLDTDQLLSEGEVMALGELAD